MRNVHTAFSTCGRHRSLGASRDHVSRRKRREHPWTERIQEGFFPDRNNAAVEAGRRSVINIPSELARFALLGYDAYAAVKGAIKAAIGGGAVRNNAQ